jgi:signal transduction histidine kinase/ActR/RegA family two-component response regulator
MSHLIICLPLLSCFISIFLFAYVAGQRQKNELNKAFLGFTIVVIADCLADFSMRLFAGETTGTIIAHIAVSLTLLLGYVYQRFIYALLGRANDFHLIFSRYAIPICAAFTLAFGDHFLHVTQRHSGYVFEPTLLFAFPFIICVILPGIYSLFLWLKRFSLNDAGISRKQISLVFKGTVFSIVYETILVIVLPIFFHNDDLLPFSSFGIVIHSVFIYRAIRRYNLFTVDIEQIQRVTLHTFENIKEAILLFDKDGNLLQANSAASELFGNRAAITPEFIGQCIADYSYEKEYSNFLTTCQCCEKNSTLMISQSLIKQTDRILAKIVIIRDITEQVRIEREMQRINRIESIGVLAGGIAHDFNNYLMGIYTVFGLLRLGGRLSKEDESVIKEGETAAHHASRLTRQLLTFSKGDAPDMSALALEPLLNDVLSFSLRGAKSRYRICVPDDVVPVFADKGQISQVIQNLALNAEQAMPDGGWITVSAENCTLMENDLPALPTGSYVRLMFTDEGTGMPASIIDKIFDPYFTTKSKGNGLGLSIVHSIISKHKGHIEVSSQEGKGTTFTLFLKAAITPLVAQQKQISEQFHGSGKILVMDDDPVIRLLLGRVLTTCGFTVELAENGEQALSLYDVSVRRREHYKAVITDLTIRGAMGGKVLGEKLLLLDPHIKIIIASGYSQDPVLANYRQYGFCASIRKPYSVEELKSTLQKVFQN